MEKATAPHRPDRRVEKTREQLRAGLRAVMEEKGFDRATVQDILDRANVRRTTFYAHYPSKEALLDDSLDQLAAWLDAKIREDVGARPLAFSLPMLEHADSARRLYRTLVGRRSAAVVQNRVRRVIARAARAELASLALRPDVPLDALVEHVVGSYFALLTWWFDHRTGLGPAEADRLFRRLTEPVLRAAAGYLGGRAAARHRNRARDAVNGDYASDSLGLAALHLRCTQMDRAGAPIRR